METPRPVDDVLADVADALLAASRQVGLRTRGPMDHDGRPQTQIAVMRFVDRNPGCSPSVVAAGTGIKRTNVSAALRELEADGLVERNGDAEDGRGVRLRSTPRAAANLADIRHRWARLLGDALGEHVAVDELERVLALLTELERRLTEKRGTADGDAV